MSKNKKFISLYCPECGTVIKKSSSICSNCGLRLKPSRKKNKTIKKTPANKSIDTPKRKVKIIVAKPEKVAEIAIKEIDKEPDNITDTTAEKTSEETNIAAKPAIEKASAGIGSTDRPIVEKAVAAPGIIAETMPELINDIFDEKDDRKNENKHPGWWNF